MDLPGGAFWGADGRAHTFMLAPNAYSFQPGHTYLLLLLPSQNGTYAPIRNWDVTSGTLVPNTRPDAAQAARAQSSLAGLSTEQATRRIQQTLAGR